VCSSDLNLNNKPRHVLDYSLTNMRRRLFSIVTVMSLLLCVVSVAMWVRSLSYWDELGFNGDSVQMGAAYVDGWFGLGIQGGFGEGWYCGSTRIDNQIDIDWIFDTLHEVSDYNLSFAGVHFFQNIEGNNWLVFIPIWMTTLLTLPAPILWLIFFRKNSRRYRLAHGLCGGCGYDMRASEWACPECGAGKKK